MTAISKYPEPHVVSEPSTTSTTALNGNGNSKNVGDDTSKRKWRYCPSDGGEGDDGENEANCSGYDELVRISSPVPTFPHIPWSQSRQYSADLEGLHYELLECFDWLRPTEAERFARCNVCQRVRNVLVDITPDAIFYVFGSVATNLFLPTSDIDISVELQRLSPYDMQIVAEAFRNSKNFKDVNVLDRAHVPIIKLTDRETNINIDISFNTTKAHCAVQYIMAMRYYFPALELFTLILKQFLASKQLNQAFTGGLSSYGLVLMIVHYMLRHHCDAFLMIDLSQLPIGLLSKFLLEFLEFYGNIFNPLNDALAFPQPTEAVLTSKAHLTAVMNENFYTAVLCVQDPLTPLNDVGRGAHNFMQVKAAFSSAFAKLNGIIRRDRLSKSGEPMLQSIMTFSPNFVQFRRRINCLPSENISEHNGNMPLIFGGQPLQPFYENAARDVVIHEPPPPHLFFPTLPQHLHQQQHANTSTFENENGISLEPLSSSSSSETSSATPTAFPSPRAAADIIIPREAEYYHPSFQTLQMPPPPLQQQQIFFPPPFQHLQQQQPRQEMYHQYNPYFGISPPLPHLQPLLPPPYHYIHDYGCPMQQQPPEYGYSESESYYNDNEEEQQIEDDFEKMLSLADDEDSETKLNNGNISDASDSSGLSSGSTDGSMISCSTVTPEFYDEQLVTAEDEEESSSGGDCSNNS